MQLGGESEARAADPSPFRASHRGPWATIPRAVAARIGIVAVARLFV